MQCDDWHFINAIVVLVLGEGQLSTEAGAENDKFKLLDL